MKIYARYGFREFVLCLGYKGEQIKQYFLSYEAMTRDVTIRPGFWHHYGHSDGSQRQPLRRFLEQRRDLRNIRPGHARGPCPVHDGSAMTRRRVGVLVVCGVCLTLASPPTRRLDAQGNGGIEARPGAVARTPADAELQGGLQAYKAKDFVRARAHFQAALRLDPTGTYAALFLARSIHAQYRPGVATAENTATAREAIAAYRQVLAKNPNQDEAYEAGVLLYEALREDAELREWVLQRARSQSVPTGRRAAAYLFLARKTGRARGRPPQRVPGLTATGRPYREAPAPHDSVRCTATRWLSRPSA